MLSVMNIDTGWSPPSPAVLLLVIESERKPLIHKHIYILRQKLVHDTQSAQQAQS